MYILKFRPILKERIWGGDRLVKELGKGGSKEECRNESGDQKEECKDEDLCAKGDAKSCGESGAGQEGDAKSCGESGDGQEGDAKSCGEIGDTQKVEKTPLDEAKIGESWEISALQSDLSVVANGELKGNNIEELISIYMGDLVGDRVYEKFGIEFPLLIKFIDAQDDLSIQVHPDDTLAAERHHSYGKTEMWYIMNSRADAKIHLGFKGDVDSQKYLAHLADDRVEELLQTHPVKKDDAFFIPAGAVHAIGRGVMLAEIQQTSDITYRLYDYNRVDKQGLSRELHTELALQAINFDSKRNYNITAPSDNENGGKDKLVECPYFRVNLLQINREMKRNYHNLDSFVVMICTEGEMTLRFNGGEESIHKGETVLVPAVIEELKIEGGGKLLEVYIPE